MNLDKETGISIMKVEEKLDTGPICNSYKIDIKQDDNAITISEKLSLLASNKILNNIDDILENNLKFIDQDHTQATYANKIKKAEGKINWNDPAKNIIGKINGLNPMPGAWFLYNGERYKVLKAEICEGVSKPGDILDDYLIISCQDKSVKILEIQREGKRPQNINEFKLGSRLKKGMNLNNV